MPQVSDSEFSNIQVRLTFRFGKFDKNDAQQKRQAQEAYLNASKKKKQMQGKHDSVVAPRQRSNSEIAKEQEEVGNISSKISGLMSGAIGTQMFEPYKTMRVIFQIKEIRANLPQGVLSCDLGADFQVKPCDPRAMLQKQIMDRRVKKMEKTYAGKIQKFNEILPPDLKR